jgi:hypothetical protein
MQIYSYLVAVEDINEPKYDAKSYLIVKP